MSVSHSSEPNMCSTPTTATLDLSCNMRASDGAEEETTHLNNINNAESVEDTSSPKTPLDKRREMSKRTVRLDLKENHTPVKNNPINEQIQPKSIIKKNMRGRQSCTKRAGTEQRITPSSSQPIPFSFNTPNSLVDASFLVRDRGTTPSRAHSTPLAGEMSTPKSGRLKYIEKKKLNVISDCELQEMASIVRRSVVSCYKISQKWQKTKLEGATHLQEFVAQKLDAQGGVTKILNYIAVMHMSDLSEVIKSMCGMSQDMRAYVQHVGDLRRKEELYGAIKPFTTMNLCTIADMLESLRKRYRCEFAYKNDACNTLMLACGHSKPAEQSADLLNNILAVWSNDVHIKRKDPHLVALMHEVGGFDDN